MITVEKICCDIAMARLGDDSIGFFTKLKSKVERFNNVDSKNLKTLAEPVAVIPYTTTYPLRIREKMLRSLTVNDDQKIEDREWFRLKLGSLMVFC